MFLSPVSRRAGVPQEAPGLAEDCGAELWLLSVVVLSFLRSLRFLNASANKLENPPSSRASGDQHALQELYLTNSLTDKCVPLLTGHPHLKILHMAYNRLQSFPAR